MVIFIFFQILKSIDLHVLLSDYAGSEILKNW
jgi:hypothetical protein